MSSVSFRASPEWATGGVGRAAMEGVLQHPDLELAGAGVHSPAKEGTYLGVLLGLDEPGREGHRRRRRVRWPPTPIRVLYSPFMADPDVVAAILESGKNWWSPLSAGSTHPARQRKKFDAIARAAGVTLHGTGIHPGGITERFPLVISAIR